MRNRLDFYSHLASVERVLLASYQSHFVADRRSNYLTEERVPAVAHRFFQEYCVPESSRSCLHVKPAYRV